MVTFSNHLEILPNHEVSHECKRLRLIIQHIQESCRISSIKGNAIKLYEDNVIYIVQIKWGFIKDDRSKHIFPILIILYS